MLCVEADPDSADWVSGVPLQGQTGRHLCAPRPKQPLQIARRQRPLWRILARVHESKFMTKTFQRA